jgi:hypothetical protein
MDEQCYVKYFDPPRNQDAETRHIDTREQAIARAEDLEWDGCTIHAIVGPDGEIALDEAKRQRA